MSTSVNNQHQIISEWVEKYTSDLFRYAYSKLNDREQAEDIVQETFIAAYKSIDSFEGRSAVKTWLISILNNKITDFYRSKSRKFGNDVKLENSHFFLESGHWRVDERPENWEGNLLDDEDFLNVLQSCIKALPDAWASVVIMKFQENVDSKIVCETLELSQSNFWQIIHRAKLQLRKCVELNWINL
ncbi:MAG: sigma-70 family RNA polymerase sigma factor [Flavobacteriales bacterium]